MPSRSKACATTSRSSLPSCNIRAGARDGCRPASSPRNIPTASMRACLQASRAHAGGGGGGDGPRAGRARAPDIRPDDGPRGDAREAARGAARRGRDRLEIVRQEDAIAVRFLAGKGVEPRVHVLQSAWKPGGHLERHARRQGNLRCKCARSRTASTSLGAACRRRPMSIPTPRRRSPA